MKMAYCGMPRAFARAGMTTQHFLSPHGLFAGQYHLERSARVFREMIRLVVGRILQRLHVGLESLHRFADHGGGVAVAAHELGGRSERQVEQVVEDEYLAVALGAGANADGGRVDFGGDHRRHFARDAFEYQAADAGAVQSDGIAHELLDVAERLALHFVSAHDIDRLRSEADVAADGNFGVDDAADEISALFAAFDFDDLGAAFFDEPGG